MKDFKFDPSDFSNGSLLMNLYDKPTWMITQDLAAYSVNAKLEEIKAAWMAELEASGLRLTGNSPTALNQCWTRGPQFEKNAETDEYEGLLINIKKNTPKECVHEGVPNEYQIRHGGWPVEKISIPVLSDKWHCTKCGKKLKVNWTVIE